MRVAFIIWAAQLASVGAAIPPRLAELMNSPKLQRYRRMLQGFEDLPRQGDVPCGRWLKGTKQWDNLERHFYVFVPQSFCINNVAVRGDAPVLFFLHCYLCDAGYFLPLLQKFAEGKKEEQHILVIPDGHKRSWNGIDCCGIAKEKKLHDAELVIRISDMVKERLTTGPQLGLGYSNGAYLMALIGMNAKNPFTAIAIAGGYQSKGWSNVVHPVPFFITHSSDDKMVKYTGCCEELQCCCGIKAAAQCHSVPNVFARYQETNVCRNTVEIHDPDVPGTAKCMIGTNCTAATKFCLWADAGHFIDIPRQTVWLKQSVKWFHLAVLRQPYVR